ncbi:MAG: response regulator transcription factor [Flavobacteriales bacterium]|nr:response regulator transcription factor [Flavobacteriales bacterium]
MDKIKAIIVEDEEASRVTLRNYLEKHCPTVELLGEAKNINEGYDLINLKKPQLVFLDVEMPFGNAFDLLEKFDSLNFEVVFVTAFSKYALEALNLSASNYLLKPVSIDELVDAVKKVKQQISDKNSVHTSNILLENLAIENRQSKKMVLPMLDGFEVVTLNEIIRCDANDNLTDIYLTDRTKRTVCRTLKFYEETLSDYDFVRVHKSHIVNINFVKQYKKGKGGEVILSDGSYVRVSPTRKKDFLDKFSQ